MVQALYNLLPTFHDGQSHRRQLSKSLWRTVRQRQRLIFAFVLAFIFCATSFKVIVSSRKRWPMVPVAPPTPFILKGLPSSESTTLSAPYLTSSFPAPQYRPACAPLTSISPRYASLSTSKSNSTIYLALNLLDAQAVLPTFIHELPALLSYMGSRRFHVSILENGSKDMSADLLVALARALASVGCSYEIVVRGDGVISHKENGRRIVELARLRNAALKSLYNGRAAKHMGIKKFDMVLFMNDIVWCTSDMLELLKQHIEQESHMTCATDWGWNVVYDRWVARTMSGLPLYSQETLLQYFNGPNAFAPPYPEPFPYDDHERNQFRNLEPFQVFSCWNGAVVIDARAFFLAGSSDSSDSDNDNEDGVDGPHEGHDRTWKGSQRLFDPVPSEYTTPSSAIRFRTGRNDVSPTTEKASECFLLCVDLWRRGMGKILLVPRASVAYDLWQYERVRQDGRRNDAHPIGIEASTIPSRKTTRVPFFSSTSGSTGRSSSRTGKDSDAKMGEDVIKRVPWRSAPPTMVVYHDYAWWHEKERWGPWDEA